MPQLEAAGMAIMPIAVALIIGFSLAMMLSPMGPAVTLLARFGRVSQLKVAFGWNGLFVAAALPLPLVFLALRVLATAGTTTDGAKRGTKTNRSQPLTHT